MWALLAERMAAKAADEDRAATRSFSFCGACATADRERTHDVAAREARARHRRARARAGSARASRGDAARATAVGDGTAAVTFSSPFYARALRIAAERCGERLDRDAAKVLQLRRTAVSVRSGSDGTRTRDLRRDRPAL